VPNSRYGMALARDLGRAGPALRRAKAVTADLRHGVQCSSEACVGAPIDLGQSLGRYSRVFLALANGERALAAGASFMTSTPAVLARHTDHDWSGTLGLGRSSLGQIQRPASVGMARGAVQRVVGSVSPAEQASHLGISPNAGLWRPRSFLHWLI